MSYTTNGLTCLIVFGFVVYYAFRGYTCPCPPLNNRNTSIPCSRYEIYGWQINHIVFYAVIGALFPDDFWWWQGLGVLWELVEFIPYVYPSVLAYVGGCVDSRPPRQVHWLDRSVGLPSPHDHFWHVKLTDVVLNVVGFGVGVCLYRVLSTLYRPN